MLQTCVSQDSLMIVISLIALPCQKSGAFHCLNLPVLRMCHHWKKVVNAITDGQHRNYK